jgi:hypothetical protein
MADPWWQEIYKKICQYETSRILEESRAGRLNAPGTHGKLKKEFQAYACQHYFKRIRSI